MDSSQFTIWIFICVAAHAIRTTYEVLKHRKIVRPNRITFAIILPVMLLLWASWMSASSTDILPLDFPDVVRYFGLAVCIIGVAIFIVALVTIRALESYDGPLMTKGIYSVLRHPMYFAFILWLYGFPVFFGGGLTMAISWILMVNVLWWRYYEERELSTRFPEYEEYRKKTIF